MMQNRMGYHDGAAALAGWARAAGQLPRAVIAVKAGALTATLGAVVVTLEADRVTVAVDSPDEDVIGQSAVAHRDGTN
jgi:hypothetical protein